MKLFFRHENLFKRWSLIILLLILALSVFLAFQLQKLRFDYDFEKFFPAQDEESDFFFEYRQKFESDNDFLLIAIQNEKGIFDSVFLKKVNSLATKLEKQKDIVSLTSITKQEEKFLYAGGATSSRPYITKNYKDLKSDSIRIFNSPELLNTLIAKDAASLCIYVKHTEYISKKRSDNLITNVSRICDSYTFDKVRIAGRTIGQKYYIDKMSSEMALFIGLSFVLMILFLYIAFKSLWGILLPQVVIIFSMLWIVGLMGLFREPINLILVTLPSIMFVVSMSDVIHLVSRYLDALRISNNKFESLKIAIKEVGSATFLTSLTTAIGFYSLYFVRVQPIQIFGIITGTGVLVAFLLTITLMPALIYLSPSPKYISKAGESHFWKKYLSGWFIKVLKNPKRIIYMSLITVAVSSVGISMIDTNNYLMDDLKEGEPMKDDFNYLDTHYGGVRPFELAVILKDTNRNFWQKDILNEIEKIENYTENIYGAQLKFSLVKTIKLLNKASHLGNKDYNSLPESQRAINRFRMPVKIADGGKLYHRIVDSSETVTRISGSMPDLGNQIILEKNLAFKKFVSDSIDPKLLNVKLTGTAHLFDKNMRYLSQSLVKGLSVSVLIVALIMGFLYKSFRMMLISVVPNLLPLLVIGAIMGFCGIDLKVSTSIIFVIAFGIAVDDTIHFLGKFKLELRKGRSKLYALKRAYLTTGKAMIITTLILCSGFLLLMLSSFLGTFFMGLLLCITLFVALILDLTLLPVLLLLFYKIPKK